MPVSQGRYFVLHCVASVDFVLEHFWLRSLMIDFSEHLTSNLCFCLSRRSAVPSVVVATIILERMRKEREQGKACWSVCVLTYPKNQSRTINQLSLIILGIVRDNSNLFYALLFLRCHTETPRRHSKRNRRN